MINYSMKKLITIILILSVILISGCSQENKNTYQENIERNPIENAIDSNQEQITSSDNNYCTKLENEVWRKRCSAFVELNLDYCEAFYNGNPSGDEDIEECYYLVSIHSNAKGCDKLFHSYDRALCKAISKKDVKECPESFNDCVIDFMLFYKDKSACDYAIDKEKCLNEYNTRIFTEEEMRVRVLNSTCQSYCSIINKTTDCNSIEDHLRSMCLNWQALAEMDSQKCDGSLRNYCIGQVAQQRKDVSVCRDVESSKEDRWKCIETYARILDAELCTQSGIYANKCILESVMEMDETGQEINVDVCNKIIKDENKKALCYVEYAKSTLKMI